ncbi:MAG TPA: GreA/GreB family elongation factor [Methylotenera sp.]|nr:GreA/GreB family elongation factor [Methylotenera sp.]
MSRGFVKEDDLEHAGTDLPERPVSEHPNYVTPTGLEQLQAQSNELDQERQRLTPSKEDAVIQQRLEMIDRDLRYLQARLEHAILVEPASQPKDLVLFGATVEVEYDDGEHSMFSIVGEDEADIALQKVSWVSPLAKALIGHKVGDNVVWKRPAGDLNIEIIKISY